MNIGAGRVVWQDIVRIDVSIKKKQFHKNPAILDSCKRAKEGNGRLHLLGLVSTRVVRCVGEKLIFSFRYQTAVFIRIFAIFLPFLRLLKSKKFRMFMFTFSGMVVILRLVLQTGTVNNCLTL